MALPTVFRYDVWVKTTQGVAVNNAHVYLVQQPATVPATEALGPPSPLATNFTDSTGGTVEPQPDVTDGFGHAEFYAASGIYTIAVYVNGSLFMTLPDQNIAIAVAPPAVSSINSLTGALTLAAGTNITLGTVGNTITINGPATGVTSLNALTGALSITAGSGITVTPSGSNIQIAATGALPASPLLGDTIRWNVNGDNAWDSVPYAQKFVGAVTTSTWAANISNNTVMSAYGYIEGTGFTSNVSATRINNTATQTWGGQISFGSAASTNMGIAPFGWTSTQCLYNVMNWQRITWTSAISTTATVRHWQGMIVNGSGTTTGGNGTQLLAAAGSSVMNTDTPNKSFIAFRYSTGTDTHWQAVCSVAGASSPTQTIVDTGITPDTGVHTFSLVQNFAGTQITFYIDGSLVATISTNLPSATPTNAGDAQATLCFTVDNKNTATTMSVTFYNANMSIRG